MTKQTKEATFAELVRAAQDCAGDIFDNWATHPVTAPFSTEDPSQIKTGIRRIGQRAAQAVMPAMDHVDGPWAARMLTEQPDLTGTSVDGTGDILNAVYWAVSDAVAEEASRHVSRRTPEPARPAPSP
jgi:hypothetical protein